ncbi:MAG: hypothetical protein OJF48_002619 [Afipia sp.]|jgi:hypothetical protein|nr:MAG: hypothetical protein OJF48_002619 [Afipia sp.]
MTAARIAIALMVSLCAATLAHAQEWPTRPITLSGHQDEKTQ